MKVRFEQFREQCPVVAILRGLTTSEVPAVCDALYAAGITLLEIPLNSPDPITTIAAAVKHCGSRQMVGAGTVLSPEDVRNVASVGGTFIISLKLTPAPLPNSLCVYVKYVMFLSILWHFSFQKCPVLSPALPKISKKSSCNELQRCLAFVDC